MFTSSLLHGEKEEVVAQEFPLRKEPLGELLIKRAIKFRSRFPYSQAQMDGVQPIMIRPVRMDQAAFFFNLSSQPFSRDRRQIEELRVGTLFSPKKSIGLWTGSSSLPRLRGACRPHRSSRGMKALKSIRGHALLLTILSSIKKIFLTFSCLISCAPFCPGRPRHHPKTFGLRAKFTIERALPSSPDWIVILPGVVWVFSSNFSPFFESIANPVSAGSLRSRETNALLACCIIEKNIPKPFINDLNLKICGS
jgi:hypothetical protein